jgi:hypothetical protein
MGGGRCMGGVWVKSMSVITNYGNLNGQYAILVIHFSDTLDFIVYLQRIRRVNFFHLMVSMIQVTQLAKVSITIGAKEARTRIPNSL